MTFGNIEILYKKYPIMLMFLTRYRFFFKEKEYVMMMCVRGLILLREETKIERVWDALKERIHENKYKK